MGNCCTEEPNRSPQTKETSIVEATVPMQRTQIEGEEVNFMKSYYKEVGVKEELKKQLDEKESIIRRLIKYIESVDHLMFPVPQDLKSFVFRDLNIQNNNPLANSFQGNGVETNSNRTKYSSAENREIHDDGQTVWEGRKLNGLNHGKGTLRIKNGDKEVQVMEARFMCGLLDGYRIKKEKETPIRTVKEVFDKNEPVFIKSVEKKDLYLTCEIENFKPHGMCVFAHSSTNACYIARWDKGTLRQPAVYQKIYDVDTALLTDIRKKIHKECTDKDLDESSVVEDMITFEPKDPQRQATRFGTELE